MRYIPKNKTKKKLKFADFIFVLAFNMTTDFDNYKVLDKMRAIIPD